MAYNNPALVLKITPLNGANFQGKRNMPFACVWTPEKTYVFMINPLAARKWGWEMGSYPQISWHFLKSAENYYFKHYLTFCQFKIRYWLVCVIFKNLTIWHGDSTKNNSSTASTIDYIWNYRDYIKGNQSLYMII